jgi:hypothetical protein
MSRFGMSEKCSHGIPLFGPPCPDCAWSEGMVCDHRYDPMSRCDGVYVSGECDQCGRPTLLPTRSNLPGDSPGLDGGKT